MKLWLITLIAVGILALGGIVMASSQDIQQTSEKEISNSATSCNFADSAGSCGHQKCGQENNCGMSSCQAAKGTGSCGCGAKA
ncbi:MAG TPA: hypothetical protein VJ912_03420 [Candidatus Nanoarchaeia archaeon]|nr:hypothetical protein [Candidatus Nanoarchaeia archaeon]